MSVSAYPLEWPRHVPRRQQRDSARWRQDGKRLTVAQARRRLIEEIDKMTKPGHTYRVDPDLVIVSTNIRSRGDGMPYSNAREPEDPAVAVYFELDGEPHCMPCDAWDRVADNIAAVAAHIGAMRGIERWGVSDIRQAFTAFKALPSSASNAAGAWWVVLEVDHNASPDDVRAAYQRRRKETHPDHGGDAAQFSAVQRAWEQYQEARNG